MASPELTVVRLPEDFRAACEAARARGARVAFVPTMGALHEGHLALIRAAREHAGPGGMVAASIFVNPTQFGPNEDFTRYPRDLDGDTAKLARAGADLVFAPDAHAMYSAGDRTRVRVHALDEPLCGAFRPGHFEGVATVVAKLFALLGAGVAVFGRKDYQQLVILHRMAKDLFFPIEIVGHPILREADGLALSSRNAYLSAEERARALGLSRGLRAASLAYASGERSAEALAQAARAEVVPRADRVDYVSLVDPDDLTLPEDGRAGPRALLAIAAYIGKTRLIDNVVLGEDPPPLGG